MFARKEKLEAENIIGKETELKGTLKNTENIHIEGKVEGKIQSEGDVIVGEDAIVKANIQAKSASIRGKVVGNITCQGKVELFPSGSLKGNVKASDLTIPEGAFFDGKCKMIASSKSEIASPD